MPNIEFRAFFGIGKRRDEVKAVVRDISKYQPAFTATETPFTIFLDPGRKLKLTAEYQGRVVQRSTVIKEKGGSVDFFFRDMELTCPTCDRIAAERGGGHANSILVRRTREGVPLYHCSQCNGDFLEDSKFGMTPVFHEKIGHVCPACKKSVIQWEIFTNPQDGSKLARLFCTNDDCKSKHGDFSGEPWFMDLSERDFNQWFEIHKKKLSKGPDIVTQRRLRDKGLSGHEVVGKDFYDDTHSRSMKFYDSQGIKKRIAGSKTEKLKYISDQQIKRDTQAKFLKEFGILFDPEDDNLRKNISKLPKGQQAIAKEKWLELYSKSADAYEKKQKEYSKHEHDSRTGKISGFLRGLEQKTGPTIANGIFALVLILIGIAASAFTGIWEFTVALVALGIYVFIPSPDENQLSSVTNRETDLRFLGVRNMFNQVNRYNSGLALMKSLSKMVAILFIGLAFYNSNIPLSALFLIFITLYIGAGLKITYNSKRPDEILESFIRLLMIPFIAFMIYGAGGGGIFQSPALGLLYLAFFLIIPKPDDPQDIARTMGRASSGIYANYEMMDKVIFVIIMSMGGLFSFLGAGTSGLGVDMFSGGVTSVVFSAVYVIAFVVGIASPSETRPTMGILIMIVGFVAFGSAFGDQILGSALFGEWWPTVHNTATEVLEPFGELFDTFSNTFSQTFLLISNPVGFASQITQGTYTDNEYGKKGAYGLEITNFDVETIYLREPFAISFDLENDGQFNANYTNIEIWSNINNVEIKDFSTPETKDDILLMQPYEEGSGIFDYLLDGQEVKADEWIRYVHPSLLRTPFGSVSQNERDYIERYDKITVQDIKPLFYQATIECSDIESSQFFKKDANLRQHYISFMVKTEYEYEVYSSLQVNFFSHELWLEKSREDQIQRSQVRSLITTAPVKLSIGSMDQPIREDNPFYLGFNLTGDKDHEVGKAIVRLVIPEGIEKYYSCQKEPTREITQGTDQVLEWVFEEGDKKYTRCYFNAPDFGDEVKVPERTFTITGSASYVISTWKKKDTLINFADSCEEPEEEDIPDTTTPDPVSPAKGSEYFCKDRVENSLICNHGEGGCKSDDECSSDKGGADGNDSLKCIYLGSQLNVFTCCWSNEPQINCTKAYDAWKNQ